MAQLKVKQISDFVSAVGTIHNATVGTAGITAISVAKSDAISSAFSADVVAISSALSSALSGDVVTLSSAVSADVVAKSEAISSALSSALSGDVVTLSSAVSADVVVLSSAKSYADQAELDAIASAVSQAESKDVARATTTASNLSGAISTEVIGRNDAISVAKSGAISSAFSADAVLSTAVSSAIATVDGRVTTLLGGSTEALDTFGEIKGFIDSLAAADVTVFAAISTAVSNDVDHARGIADNAANIASLDTSAQGYADTAESNANGYTDGRETAITSAYQSYADQAELDAIASALSSSIVKADAALASAQGYADQAELDAIASANGYTDGRETAITSAYQSYADQAELDAIASAALDATTKADAALASATVLTTALDSRIDTLEGQDIVQQAGVFVNRTSFTVAERFVTGDLGLKVFINGLQIHANASGDGYTTVDGMTFNLVTLGYDIDANDHIVVYGVKTV